MGASIDLGHVDCDLTVGLVDRCLDLAVEPGHVVLNLSFALHQRYIDVLKNQ